MLMKPMQKVTRYPLLFKRLLPNMTPGTDDFDSLTILINSLEQAIFKLNETVRHMESRFRIRLIDKTLDFGLVADKFKIAIDDRQLLMENNLFYINQKADTLIEVVVFLFNDMLLIARRSKKVLGGYILYKPPIPLEQVVFLDQSADESKFHLSPLFSSNVAVLYRQKMVSNCPFKARYSYPSSVLSV